MSIKIDIRADVDEMRRRADKIVKKQLPYATSMAINAVAKEAEKAVQKEIKANVQNPVSFTTKGTFMSPSNKNNKPITATVGIKDTQAKYLEYGELGGTSKASGKAKPVPTTPAKNRYGNAPRNMTKAIGNGKVFSGAPRGGGRPGGIYQRAGTKKKPKLKMLASWHKSTHHTKKTRFGERVGVLVKRLMAKELSKQIAKAIGA